MFGISRSYRRLIMLVASIPVLLVLLAVLYQAGMHFLEGQPRSFGESLQWAAGTLTTTGFGRDSHWTNPVMEGFVIFVEFAGVVLIFLVFPIFVIPFLEERFEARLPTRLPNLADRVLVFRYGPAVSSLIEELEPSGVPAVIFEDDEATARRLHDRGLEVVLGDLEEDDSDFANLVGARGLVLNGSDNENAAMTLSARYHGFQGPIVALIVNPLRRPALIRAGATNAFTPDHVLAAAIAARASTQVSPRLSSARHLGHHLEVVELRVHAGSPLAGKTIAEANVRSTTGATIVGWWSRGTLVRQPSMTSRIEVGTILVAVGSQSAIEKLGALATPVRRPGPFLVIGHGKVGRKVAEFLRDAGESVVVVDEEDDDGVDVAGDVLSPTLLAQAGVHEAQAVVLAFATDSAALFATAVVRNLAREVVIITAASRAENVGRMHRAGADFALSVGQVSGQLLAFHLLGEHSVSLEADIKIIATAPGSLVGRPLDTHDVRERTGCSVVAVERAEQVIVELGGGLELAEDDIVYLSGTNETFDRYYDSFPGTRAANVPLRASSEVSGTSEATASP